MILCEEYRRQAGWRDWDSYIKKLPLSKNDIVLDLGCGIGTFASILSRFVTRIIGIDINPDLIKAANNLHSNKNVDFIIGDLAGLKKSELPLADGIWAAFSASYFPDFASVLLNWLQVLKPNGWIAIVEVSDLFGHEPLDPSVHKSFAEYYQRQLKSKDYDFRMGSKLQEYLTNSGLQVIHEEKKFDKELTFNGPAEPQILEAWNARFDRMYAFQEYLGGKRFQEIKGEFMNCLSLKEHFSNTEVVYIIAKKVITFKTGK